MKKKEYIDAINEFKASKSLKSKTLEKITRKKNYIKTYLAVGASAFIFVMAISIGISPINNNKNRVEPLENVEQNEGLPKLENFENLYDIIKEKEEKYYDTNERFLTDASSNTNSSASFEEAKTIKDLDYSKTNVQVEGVDEADIVKTDGNYIYYVSSNKIIIVDAKDSNDLKVVFEINYEEEDFYPNELYINKNKLIVIGENGRYSYRKLIEVDTAYPSYNKNSSSAKVYNIKDKSNPKLEREVQIEGNYLSSRMIGDNIYFITNEYIYSYLFRNKEISELDENSFKPKYKDTAVSNEEKSIEYNDIYYFPESEDTSYLNIAGFNINSHKEVNIKTYLGAGSDIYSSQDNLYITRVKYEYKDSYLYDDYDNHNVKTYIYKFKLEDSKIAYVNAGSVPGKVLNQFSMDEKDGYFRIATTDSKSWNSKTNTNNLYVLDENLKIVGKIEGLAKGEKIYSVRFMGNRAYMVTFVETDPLFVIDLSKPENPTVLGELKIPGYSKYLHPYDETHIIGFGENTKTNKYGGVVTDGMKMALFDVSNPNSPKELYSVDIGDKGTYSEILNNHKALLFSKEKNIIAFPVSISEEAGEYRTKLKFQGAIVYGLDLEKGFTLKGRIAHMEIKDGYKNYDSEKAVERIIYIKDSLYTLSRGVIKATNMNTMQEESKIDL